jgi:CHAD domain-containing protein
MATRARSAHPLQNLRECILSLEAAILLCLAKPNETAVHRVRTSIRRTEAQLELLSILPGLPPHQRQAKKTLSLLRKIRRAAGQVRDLDVQRDLLHAEACSKNTAHRGDPEMRKQSRQLRRELKLKREKHANHLLHLLRKHEADLPLRFEKLMEALAPAQSLTLSEAELTSLALKWFQEKSGWSQNGHHSPVDLHGAPRDFQQLHDIRKRAKSARYIAESAPESAKTARGLAARFEKLQQAGGDWHDFLLLSGIAADRLGESARLPQTLHRKAERTLHVFERQLRTSL